MLVINKIDEEIAAPTTKKKCGNFGSRELHLTVNNDRLAGLQQTCRVHIRPVFFVVVNYCYNFS